MKRYSSLLLLFSLLFLSTQAQTRNGTLFRGRVIDHQTKLPVEYADVYIVEGVDNKPTAHALTNEKGLFEIGSNSSGTIKLLVHYLGYKDHFSAEFNLNRSNQTITLNEILLQPDSESLSEVEVTGRRKQVVYKLDKRVVEAGSNANNAGGTAVDVLRNAPSISIDVEGNVKFRGSSGFKVYINGRPSLFEGTQALEQIPAGQIDNIEIITTPSARYETDGSVGILNIITKKNTTESLMGIFNANGSTVGSRGVDFMLSQKNKQLTWMVGGATFMQYRKSDYEQSKETLINDTTNYNVATGKRVGRNYNYSLKTSLGYEWDKSSIQLDLEGGHRGSGYDGNLNYREDVSTGGQQISSTKYRSRDYKDLYETFLSANVGFEHNFDREGQKLSGSFFATYGGNAMELFESDLFNQTEQRQRGHRARESEYRWTMRGDLSYVHPFGKEGKWESGYQYNMYMEDGDYRINMWNPQQQQFIEWDDQFCRFLFWRGIHTVYTMASDKIGNFSYQIGVRSEYTDRKLESSMKWAEHVERRMEFFPSAHVGYSFLKSNTISGGYSRRTTRPQLYFMEPYITYVDIYTAQIGNPAVRPEYIDAYDIGYKKDFGNNYIAVELFHRFRKDKIERIKGIYSPGVTLDSIANIGNDYSTGAEITAALSLKKWWQLNLTGSLFNYRVENQFKTNGGDSESLNWQARFANTFNIGKTTTLQFDGEFVGPSVSTQGRTDAYFFANMAVKQSLMHNQLTAILSIRDIFASARYYGSQRAQNVEVLTTIRPYSPLLQLSVAYTFNNFKSRKSSDGVFQDLFEGTNR